MAKPFITCPKHGWTERIASLGPCKKCIEESSEKPVNGLEHLFGLKIMVSKYLPDDAIFVSPNTASILIEWYQDAKR